MGNHLHKGDYEEKKRKKRNKKASESEAVENNVPAVASPTHPQRPTKIARALYTYEGRNQDDLSFTVGDSMYILSEEGSWWMASHCRTHEEGYVPYNYVVIEDGKPTSLDCFYDIGRREADKNLLLMGNPSGTYIIRPSSDSRHYALSIRYYSKANNMWVIKHYKIRTTDEGYGCYINPKLQFSCIKDLMNHYTEQASGLCCPLTLSCPRTYKPPIGFRDIEVNRESISRVRKLGNGSFGDVYLCLWNGILEVAVKTLRPNAMDRSKFITEAELMHKLHHPQIVQILGVCTQPANEEVFIITELMANGSLLDYLRTANGARLKIGDMIDFMGQISEGMSFLEAMNFIHRDLRAANILVSGDMRVKVADFGLAQVTQMEDDNIYQAHEGTKFPIKWTAPEAALDRSFSIKSDVWSFGVLMYEIVTRGRTPYPGMSHREILEQIRVGYRMPNPDDGEVVTCPEEVYQIMRQCWDSRAENRPTFNYLKGVFDDWIVATEAQYIDGQSGN